MKVREAIEEILKRGAADEVGETLRKGDRVEPVGRFDEKQRVPKRSPDLSSKPSDRPQGRPGPPERQAKRKPRLRADDTAIGAATELQSGVSELAKINPADRPPVRQARPPRQSNRTRPHAKRAETFRRGRPQFPDTPEFRDYAERSEVALTDTIQAFEPRRSSSSRRPNLTRGRSRSRGSAGGFHTQFLRNLLGKTGVGP